MNKEQQIEKAAEKRYGNPDLKGLGVREMEKRCIQRACFIAGANFAASLQPKTTPSGKPLVELSCMVCGEFFMGPEPKMCCSGRDCGCMGWPVDPVVCSEECYYKLPGVTKPDPVVIGYSREQMREAAGEYLYGHEELDAYMNSLPAPGELPSIEEAIKKATGLWPETNDDHCIMLTMDQLKQLILFCQSVK